MGRERSCPTALVVVVVAIVGCSADPAALDAIDIPGGAFIQGCDLARDPVCNANELPAREVILSAYSIDRTEVTRGAYTACVDAGACAEPSCDWDPDDSPDRPVVCVSRDAAATYCAWAGKRLPTEAEWENAARGDDGRVFAWGDDPADCDRANMLGCSGAADPVGSHPRGTGPHGLVDTGGNVCEWVADWYDASYYERGDRNDPLGPADGSLAVVRDGNYTMPEEMIRVTVRGGIDPGSEYPVVGFRCAW